MRLLLFPDRSFFGLSLREHASAYRFFFLPGALLFRLDLPSGFGLCALQCLHLVERLLQRFDQALRIGAKPLVGQPHSIAPRERPDLSRQLVRPRHTRFLHQHRDDALALLERRFDLDADEVVRVVEPPRIRTVAGIDPVLADHREEHVALGNLLFQNANEIEPWRDVVHASINSCSGANASCSLSNSRLVLPGSSPRR